MIENLIFVIIVTYIIYIIAKLFQKTEAVGNWSHLFPDMQQDPEEFYKLVEEILKEKQLPEIQTGRRMFYQGDVFSYNRLYLEVTRGDYIFHICAAPWGTGFFFSWWVRQKLSDIDQLLVLIPFFGSRIVKLRNYQSYYKLDTDAMFKKSVHQSVLAAIDILTEAKVIRLTELERKPDLRTMIK